MKKPAKKKPKETTRAEVKKLLREMVKILNRADQNAFRLWNIITALRGPDFEYSDYSDLKDHTTARVRAIIGMRPRLFANVRPQKLFVTEQINRDRALMNGSLHFKSHYFRANYAIRALYKYDLENEKRVD